MRTIAPVQSSCKRMHHSHISGTHSGGGASEQAAAGQASEGEASEASQGSTFAEDANLFIDDAAYGGVFGGNLRFRRLETSQIDLLFSVLRQVP